MTNDQPGSLMPRGMPLDAGSNSRDSGALWPTLAGRGLTGSRRAVADGERLAQAGKPIGQVFVPNRRHHHHRAPDGA